MLTRLCTYEQIEAMLEVTSMAASPSSMMILQELCMLVTVSVDNVTLCESY